MGQDDLRNAYPTDEQVERAYSLWKEKGKEGILEYFKEQRQKSGAEVVENTPAVQPETPNTLPAGALEPSATPEEKGGTNLGSWVFGVFSGLTLLVAIGKGFPPIYLLGILIWAGLAWYWQSNKKQSEAAKGVVALCAVALCIGELALIIAQTDAKESASARHLAKQQPANGSDPFNFLSRGATPIPPAYRCPDALPAGVDSRPLSPEDSLKVTGSDGMLESRDADYPETSLIWGGLLEYKNDSRSCLSMAEVELVLNHVGSVSKERHSIVFRPLLGPGQTQRVHVNLKIKTQKRGEDVALVGWHTIAVSGFSMTTENGATEADPYAKYGGHVITDAPTSK
jgi:hypothetical protein